MHTTLIRGWLALVLILSIVSVVTITTGGDVAAQTPNTFADDDGNIHEANIEYIAAAGVTKGCNPPSNTNYCPSGTVTRGQMAAFLARALELPATNADFFGDDENSVFEGDINRLAAAGITSGCNPPANTNYCPDGNVTRGQMAAFIKRGFDLPSTSTDFFNDDENSVFEGDINRLAASGVTFGCNPPANTNFCPTQTVKRDQMASFLARAMTIFPPGATTTTTSSTTTTSTSTTTTTSTTTSTTTTTTPTATVSQTTYGIYLDGTEPGGALYEPIGTPSVVPFDTPFSVRIGVSNIGTAASSVRPKIQFRYIGDVLPGPIWSDWQDVTGSSARVVAAAGSLVDNEPTTERLNGPLTFIAGLVDEQDGSINSAVVLDPDHETEFVFSIKIVAPSLPSDQYQFRLVGAASGTPFDGYGRFAAINLPFSFANGFDSGVAGNTITVSGSADPQPWSQVNPTTDPGVPRYDATSFEGSLAAKFDRLAGNPASYVRLNDFNQAQHLYGRLYFRYAGVPSPNGSRIVDVVGGYSNGDTNSHSITLTPAGKLNMKAGGAPEFNLLMTPTLAIDTWYRIEWHATTATSLSAGDGSFEARIYLGSSTTPLDTKLIAAPNAFTITEFEDADFGPRSQTIIAFIDEVALSNTGWIGP